MSKQNKQQKKIMSNLDNLELGAKIKDISIDMKKYSITNLITLIILNVLLVAVMIYYLAISNNALILTIAIISVVACIVWSVLSYLKSIVKVKYSIYQNAIVKDFDSSKTIGIYANLFDAQIKQTWLDKIGKNKTNTLCLKFKKPGVRTMNLYCINEDVKTVLDFIKENQNNAIVVFNKSGKSITITNQPQEQNVSELVSTNETKTETEPIKAVLKEEKIDTQNNELISTPQTNSQNSNENKTMPTEENK